MYIVYISLALGLVSLGLLIYWNLLRRRARLRLRNPPTKFDILAAHTKRSRLMALDMMRRQFEISLTPGKEIRINNLSAVNTRLIQLHLGVSIANPCEYPVTVEKVQWELWIGPVVKTYLCEPHIQLKAHQKVNDHVIQDVMQEQDFSEIVSMEKKKQPAGYVEGFAFCRTDFGVFDKKFFGFDVPYQLVGNLGTMIKEARTESKDNRDSLTGLLPRKFIEDNFQRIADSAGPSHPVSYIMIDVDHFKKFNDTYGHLIGDEILKTVCAKLKEVVGDKGLGIRYGGDEFCVILEGVDSYEAETIARKLHQEVGNCTLRCPQGELKITLSIGVAVLREPANYLELIKMADKALYKSKEAGRNHVSVDHCH